MSVRFVRTTSLPLYDGLKMNALWVQDSAVNPGRSAAADGFGVEYNATEIAGFRPEIEALLIERGVAIPYP